MDNQYMLSTIDNPFNPFTHYNEWYSYDVSHGYNTCAYLARITLTSDELSEDDQNIAIVNAIDEIIKFNINNLYVKVKEDYVPRQLQIQM
jgi:hypothetical protein